MTAVITRSRPPAALTGRAPAPRTIDPTTAVIRALGANPPAETVSEIIQATRLSRGDVVSTIAALAAEGRVKRDLVTVGGRSLCGGHSSDDSHPRPGSGRHRCPARRIEASDDNNIIGIGPEREETWCSWIIDKQPNCNRPLITKSLITITVRVLVNTSHEEGSRRECEEQGIISAGGTHISPKLGLII